MSRIPPRIEQIIDGIPVPGWSVRPISRDGITYVLSDEIREDSEGNHCAQDCYIAATNVLWTVVWKTRYASFDFDTDLETDVQMHFPVDLSFHENGIELIIKHEYYTDNDRVYHVMMDDGDEKLKSAS